MSASISPLNSRHSCSPATSSSLFVLYFYSRSFISCSSFSVVFLSFTFCLFSFSPSPATPLHRDPDPADSQLPCAAPERSYPPWPSSAPPAPAQVRTGTPEAACNTRRETHSGRSSARRGWAHRPKQPQTARSSTAERRKSSTDGRASDGHGGQHEDRRRRLCTRRI